MEPLLLYVAPSAGLSVLGCLGEVKVVCVWVGGLLLYHLFISFKFIPGDQIAQLALKMSDLM